MLVNTGTVMHFMHACSSGILQPGGISLILRFASIADEAPLFRKSPFFRRSSLLSLLSWLSIRGFSRFENFARHKRACVPLTQYGYATIKFHHTNSIKNHIKVKQAFSDIFQHFRSVYL